ncbi:MepB family protein [Candidatus Babeliales bacterium]|nr:MepB family protein [Candidatus Babeliales bacterium]
MSQKNLPIDLITTQEFAYKPCNLSIKNAELEAESQEYGACTFEMNGLRIKFRVAKITPTKIGQFVTLWKRSQAGITEPYDMADNIDFFVISVRNKEHFGQFVFPKAVLCEKGFVSQNGKGGKRAMRVYPAWDVAENQQAKKTQAWQLAYFFEIKQDKPIDTARVKKLFSRSTH